jgi:hypothetical protein
MVNALLAFVLAIGVMQASGVEIIAKDGMSGVDAAGTAVASTPASWEKLWRSYASDRPLPQVDFTRRRVVAIFLGSRPTAGFGIEIVGVKTEGDTTTVEWTEVRPEQGLLLAQVMTSPALIASIPTTAANVGFRKVTR